MAIIELNHLTKTFGGVNAVRSFDLTTEDGEFIVLVGPSGCGKTTTMRMIAGLEAASGGAIRIDGQDVTLMGPTERDVAMVFQNYALYPHLTVYENMAFCLRVRKWANPLIEEQVQRTAGALGISDLLQRKPAALSGGQRQRVALGRAIIREPRVFLMDEPLSNLDAQLRIEMRAEIVKLCRRLKVTTFYVTHDQLEALTMGHRIVVMQGGVVQQIDTPQRIYDEPANRFVAGFIGSPPMNFLKATPSRTGDTVGGPGFQLRSGQRLAMALSGRSGEVVAGIRPEHLRPLDRDRDDAVAVEGRIELIENLGSQVMVQLATESGLVAAQFDRKPGLEVGAPIRLRQQPDTLHAFDSRTGLSVLVPDLLLQGLCA
jgi:multiple sugar transport system ATP-binding protein